MFQIYKTTFLLRRGTAEAWEKNNPVLAKGEPGYDSTNYGIKIGDGKTKWIDLHFINITEEEVEKLIKDYLEKNSGSEEDETRFVPSISSEGILSWTKNKI